MNDRMESPSSVLFRGDRFLVEQVQRVNPDGVSRSCQVVRHPGSIVIIPVIDADRICLIKNFRVTVNQPLIELPAGTRQPAEEALDGAQRELQEETGYSAETWRLLSRFYPAPGVLDEEMFVYVAEQLTTGVPRREANEEIENLVLPVDEALDMVLDGRIRDGKTMLSLMLWQQQK